jgi:hypothetical protein
LIQGPHSDPLWKKHCMSNINMCHNSKYYLNKNKA